MSFVGRILVVVIVLLSVCVAAFTATAYSIQQNWRKSQVAAVANYDSLFKKSNSESSKLTNDVTKLKKDLEQKNTELSSAKGELGRAKQERDSLASQIEKTQANADQLQAQNGLLTAENARDKEKAASLKLQLGQAQARLDTLGEEKRKLQDSVYTLTKQNLDFGQRFQKLLAEGGTQKRLIQKAAIRLGKVEFERLQNAEIPPPVVEGLVTATKSSDRGKTFLVEISIGEDDGLKVGHKLDVSRNKGKAKFLGTIVITRVNADNAVGILEPDTKNGIIEKGDHVSTQL